MSRRNTRRDGPTTMRTVGAHEIGAPVPRSGKQMQAELDERQAAARLAALVKANPNLGHPVQMKIRAGQKAAEILAVLDAA
jgi:hypothetical protein